MGAEERVLELLDKVCEEGVFQSEISSILNFSKSTVSEILTELEVKGIVVRRKVSSRSYRVWKTEHLPFPYPGVIKLGILKSSEYVYLVKVAIEKKVVIKLFDDPIDLTRALSQGRVDMAASPLLTQLIMGILMKNFKIVRVVAKNGSGVGFSSSNNGVFGTTEMSTMDRNLRKFLSIGGREFRIQYFNSPESMIESLKKGEIEGLAIWEPYLTVLRENGFEVRYFNELLGDYICCSLAINLESLKVNREKIEDFLDSYDKVCNTNIGDNELSFLAESLGFDKTQLSKSLENYRFCPETSIDEIKVYIRESGINLSDESLFGVLEIDQT